MPKAGNISAVSHSGVAKKAFVILSKVKYPCNSLAPKTRLSALPPLPLTLYPLAQFRTTVGP